MVRFIIRNYKKRGALKMQFTFQYGQIYYELNNKIEKIEQTYLHSNMVRFIIDLEKVKEIASE